MAGAGRRTEYQAAFRRLIRLRLAPSCPRRARGLGSPGAGDGDRFCRWRRRRYSRKAPRCRGSRNGCLHPDHGGGASDFPHSARRNAGPFGYSPKRGGVMKAGSLVIQRRFDQDRADAPAPASPSCASRRALHSARWSHLCASTSSSLRSPGAATRAASRMHSAAWRRYSSAFFKSLCRKIEIPSWPNAVAAGWFRAIEIILNRHAGQLARSAAPTRCRLRPKLCRSGD